MYRVEDYGKIIRERVGPVNYGKITVKSLVVDTVFIMISTVFVIIFSIVIVLIGSAIIKQLLGGGWNL